MSNSAWLVDVGFVVKAATDGDRFKLDYIAARSFLEKRLGKTDAYLFNSIDSSLGVPPGLGAFYEVLKRQGFQVRLIEMAGDRETGTHRQQGVDEALISQFAASAEMPGIASIILTSGDAHFVPAVKEARHRHGTKTVLFSYEVNVSARLKAVVDEFWPFEAHEPTLARTQRRRSIPNSSRLRNGTPAGR